MKQKLSPNQSSVSHPQVQSQTEPTQEVREFKSPEEMLRFDASQNSPPCALVERLRQSLAKEPQARLGWWKRWFLWLIGKSNEEP
jgi:hypothetical protein